MEWPLDKSRENIREHGAYLYKEGLENMRYFSHFR
jgi:hypothetical protein